MQTTLFPLFNYFTVSRINPAPPAGLHVRTGISPQRPLKFVAGLSPVQTRTPVVVVPIGTNESLCIGVISKVIPVSASSTIHLQLDRIFTFSPCLKLHISWHTLHPAPQVHRLRALHFIEIRHSIPIMQPLVVAGHHRLGLLRSFIRSLAPLAHIAMRIPSHRRPARLTPAAARARTTGAKA